MTTPATASAQGLDVSNFQGHFNWHAAVRKNPALAFGIYRLTQGLGHPGQVSPDPDAQWNHDHIKTEGLRHGAYHFLDPRLPGAAQARYFITVLTTHGLTETDMLWLDNETAGSSPSAVAATADAFMTELDRLCPHNPRGVYTFIDFAREGNCAGLGWYDLWLAYPAASAPVAPPPWLGPKFRFWQWGQRDGTDADAFMGTAAELGAWIRSFAPVERPYRHVADGTLSLGQIAAQRGTSVQHLAEVTAAAYTPADLTELATVVLPAGVPYYSSNP